jgi:O-acetyl-ADP-ribose deacetylase
LTSAPGQCAAEGQAAPESSSSTRIEVLDADITKLDVDVITNAANTRLMHGGGVAAAISRAGGPQIQRESRNLAPIALGAAVATGAGDLPCRWVIHAATMDLGGPTSAEIIRRATANTLALADQLGARTLALVAFGTGVGGFPLDRAAAIEVAEVRKHLRSGSDLRRIVFTVRGEQARSALETALEG